MISIVIGQSLSPGNEQREFWSTAAADSKGSRNYIGIKNPAVDALVDLIINAPTRADLVIRCRALDRVLQWNHYMVPHWHLPAFRIVYWNKFGRPAKRPEPLYGLGTSAWWIDPAKAKTMKTGEQAAGETAASGETAPEGSSATSPSEASGAAGPLPAAPEARGQSPILYLLAGVIAVAIVLFVRRRRR
jgi:microcin C transport system substrate-binding protein